MMGSKQVDHWTNETVYECTEIAVSTNWCSTAASQLLAWFVYVNQQSTHCTGTTILSPEMNYPIISGGHHYFEVWLCNLKALKNILRANV
jgi:hypothetical protein